MHKNYRSWVRFGQDNYHSVDYDNLVIVTGVDLTSSCSMLAYAKTSTNMSASFSLDAAVFGSASLSAWKDRKQPELCWSSSGSDDYLAGLILPATSSGMTTIGSTSPLPRQCIFLRGWRSRSRRAPKRIQGGAGPDDVRSSPGPSEPDSLGESHEEAISEASSGMEVDIVPVVDSPVVRVGKRRGSYPTHTDNSLSIHSNPSLIMCSRSVCRLLRSSDRLTSPH
jgi:hypothetical protein